jgi:Coenzyme PQQ synthesis protein D (PqqD)
MATWRLGNDIRVAREHGGAILFNLQTGQLYSVTAIGSVILDRLLEGQSLAAVVDDLEKTYHQPRALLESDAKLFMQNLARKGLCHASDD